MATAVSLDTVQLVTHGLNPDRHKLLRDTLASYFDVLSKRGKIERQAQVVASRPALTVDQVLTLNATADALVTSLPYEGGTSTASPPEGAATAGHEGRAAGSVPAHLRYPVIGELQRAVDLGAFRHRKLILVGDLHAKIKDALQAQVPVQLTYFTDTGRTLLSPAVSIRALAQIALPEEDGQTPAGDTPPAPPAAAPAGAGAPIPVSRISTLRLGDVPFDGVVNMRERNGQASLQDPTVMDTARKLFSMQPARTGPGQEKIDAENRVYVQARRVLVVLDPELELVISDRLKFDGMEHLWRATSPEEALEILANSRTQGVVETLETDGYDALIDATSPEERDRLILALVGSRLAEYTERELAAAKSGRGALQGTDLAGVLTGVPMPVMDQVLAALQSQSMDRFLAYVPMKVRDRVVPEFLAKAEQAKTIWRGMAAAEKQESLEALVPQVLTQMFLTNTQGYEQRFPGIKLGFANTVNSQTISRLKPEQQAETFSLVAKAIEQQKPTLQLIQEKLQPAEVEQLVFDVIVKRPTDFYGRLSPAARKGIWSSIGNQYRQLVVGSLNLLDKLEVIKGLKEGALDVLFDHPAYLEFMRNPKNTAYTANLFMALKKVSPWESKGALLQRLLTEPEGRRDRANNIPKFLATPENQALNKKLLGQIDATEFRFDGLVCTKATLEPLKTQPALAGAAVILVDSLVDSTLLKAIQHGAVSRQEYETLAANVDQELQATRKKLLEKAGQDPAGVYMVETMLALNEMASQALSGNLTAAAVEQFDTRAALRQKLLDGLKQQATEAGQALAKEDAATTALAGAVQTGEQELATRSKEADAARGTAVDIFAAIGKTVEAQTKADHEKNVVASTQRDLSVEFFQLIQPLILEQVKSLSGPFGGLLKRAAKPKDKEDPAGGRAAERVIFKFTDEEIERILRYKIVFCTKDQLLLQFIVTCLRIDKLEDSLFTMATPETLPAQGIDLLFYGPGYRPEDFAERVKEKRIVQFADEAFMKRLEVNETLKARTKQTLTDLEHQISERNADLATATAREESLRQQVQQASQTVAAKQEELAALHKKVAQTRDRARAIADQVDVLETRFREFDAQFQSVRTRLTEFTSGAINEQDAARLAEELAAELMKLNEELARLMRVKSVKDIGSHVSKSTQQRIQKQIEVKERYPSNRGPVTRAILADDGSTLAQSLKRTVGQALGAYLRLNEGGLELMGTDKLAGMLMDPVPDDRLPKAQVIVIIAQEAGDDYLALRQLVSRVRRRLGLAHAIVMVPLGDIAALDPKAPARKNLLRIKDRGPLVNLSHADYADPQVVVRLLQDKVPATRPAAP